MQQSQSQPITQCHALLQPTPAQPPPSPPQPLAWCGPHQGIRRQIFCAQLEDKHWLGFNSTWFKTMNYRNTSLGCNQQNSILVLYVLRDVNSILIDENSGNNDATAAIIVSSGSVYLIIMTHIGLSCITK